MKRPNIDTIFGPADIPLQKLANKCLDFFLDSYDGYLSSYYATVKYEPEKKSYRFSNEQMNLRGRDDLLDRLSREHGGMWSMDINLEFAAAETYLAVFSDQETGTNSTLVLSMEGELTSFLEEQEEPRIPFVLFLVQIAVNIGASWFFSGLRLVDWNPLPVLQLLDRTALGSCPYVVCWKDGVLDQKELLCSLGVNVDDIKRTTVGYKFVIFFPKH